MYSLRDSELLCDRPGGDEVIDFGHETDGLVQSDDYFLIMLDVVVGNYPAFAVFEPFLANLVTADVKFPNRFGHPAEVLDFVDKDAPLLSALAPLAGRSCGGGYELHFFDDIVAFFGEFRDEIMDLGRFEKVKRNQLGALSGEGPEQFKAARQR